MKKVTMVMALGLTVSVFSSPAYAAKVFCTTCHKGHENSVGPSLASVVGAYGSVDQVFQFLNSDAPLKPKVKAFANRAKVMEAQLKRYRALDDAGKAEARSWFEGQLK